MDSREKGKRGEREIAKLLRPIFPDVGRNSEHQSIDGGSDLVNTPGYSFEVKFGKKYKSKMIRDILNQLARESRPDTIQVGIVKPQWEEKYAILPLEHFIKMLTRLETNE